MKKPTEAINWAKSVSGRNWKKCNLTTPFDLPRGYERFYLYSYGRNDWNQYRHDIRQYFQDKGEYHLWTEDDINKILSLNLYDFVEENRDLSFSDFSARLFQIQITNGLFDWQIAELIRLREKSK